MWKILDMERNALTGLVIKVISAYVLSEGNIIARKIVITELEEGEAFIPFEELTEELVISWVKEDMGEVAVLNIEAITQNDFDVKSQPKETITGNPW